MILSTAEGRSTLDASGDWRKGSLEAKEGRVRTDGLLAFALSIW